MTNTPRASISPAHSYERAPGFVAIGIHGVRLVKVDPKDVGYVREDLHEKLDAENCKNLDRIEELEGGQILNRNAIKRKQARIEKLEARLAEADTRAYAEVAAALREAATQARGEMWIRLGDHLVCDQVSSVILALIDTPDDTALDRLIAESIVDIEAERDEALNQLDSARHSVDVLERRVAEVRMLNAAMRAYLEGRPSNPPKTGVEKAPLTGSASGSDETARCAECDCEGGGEDCNWIKPGGAKTAEAKLAEAMALVEQARGLIDPCWPPSHRDWHEAAARYAKD